MPVGGHRVGSSPGSATDHAHQDGAKGFSLADVISLASTADNSSMVSKMSEGDMSLTARFPSATRSRRPGPRTEVRGAAALAALFFERRGRALDASEEARRAHARHRLEMAAIAEAAHSEEGREGLLLALEGMVAGDARLKAQLQTLLA